MRMRWAGRPEERVRTVWAPMPPIEGPVMRTVGSVR